SDAVEPPQPPRALVLQHKGQSLFFGQARLTENAPAAQRIPRVRFPARQVSDLRRGPKNNGVLEEQPVTTVTSSEPRSVERCLGGRYGSTDGFPVAAEAGRSSRGLPAPCEDAAICAWCRLPWALGRPHRSDCSEGTPMLTVAPHSTAVRLV